MVPLDQTESNDLIHPIEDGSCWLETDDAGGDGYGADADADADDGYGYGFHHLVKKSTRN